jgi:hypothetical protein
MDNSQGLKLTCTRKSWILLENLAVTKQPQTAVQVFKWVIQHTAHRITMIALLFERKEHFYKRIWLGPNSFHSLAQAIILNN